MKTSNSWIFRPMSGKIVMGLVLAAMIGSMNVLPASAENDRDHRRYEKRGHGHDRDHRRYEQRRRGHYERDHRGRRVYRSYVYQERVYLPPPVIYEPPPPPGISLFFSIP